MAILAWCGGFWCALIPKASGGENDSGRPNILLIVSDDQRPDTIAALGNEHLRTPHLDALARRGLVFTRATCAHPLCVPSRAELLTGCTGWRNGSYAGMKLNPDVPLLPKLFADAGYRTWYVGKWHTAGRPSYAGYQAVDGLFAGGGSLTPALSQGERESTGGGSLTPALSQGERESGAYIDFRGRPATGYRGWVFQTDDRRLLPEKGVGLTPDISTEFADAAIRFIEQKSGQPFFLHVNFTAPHDPRLWPTDSDRKPLRGRGALLDEPAVAPKKRALLDEPAVAPALPPLPANFLAEHPFDHGNARGRDELLLPFPRTESDVRQELACYYAVIEDMDQQIGRILTALEKTGQRDNTVVVFTSDHGLALGSHGLVGKQNMYEHTINVPLVMAGPGIPSGRQTAAQCYLRDLLPTYCDLAGLAIPEAIDGRSLAPAIRDPATEIHPFIVGYFQDSQRMIRQDGWKLIWYPKIDRRQLFHLAEDPLELKDRFGDPAARERAEQLEGELRSWLAAHRDPLVTIERVPGR